MRAGPALYDANVNSALVQPVHRLVRVVLVHHEADVLDAGVDVRLDLR